jgi:two-component system response regulator DctR
MSGRMCMAHAAPVFPSFHGITNRMLYIVDDEEVIRDSLSWLALSRGITASAYESANAFLAALDEFTALPTAADAEPQAGCILLDVRMPDTSGVALFDVLAARDLTARLPVIFLTGHGDVPMAVDMLKRGAFDFFEKPFNDNKLMDRVEEALAASRQAGEMAAVRGRLAALSAREREVLDLILDGKMNKVIADKLGISMRTVEVHRAHIFDKMHVKTAVELARLLK